MNKNQLIRYRVLDSCFSNFGRKYFLDDLIQICEKKVSEQTGKKHTFSRRTIQYDIEFMENHWIIPLNRHVEGKRIYFRYSDKDFSIDSMPLSTQGWAQIQLALDLLTQIDGVPDILNLSKIEEFSEGRLKINEKKKVLKFDVNPFLRGMNHFKILLNAVKNETVVSIDYSPFNTDKIDSYLFHPYLLKQFNKRWFCIGYNEMNKNMFWTIALDRIKSVTLSTQPYRINNIDWDDYFADIIGVTNFIEAKTQEVKIEVSDRVREYILTKPLHGSQSQKIEGNIVTLRVKLNKELENSLLDYLGDIKILQPESLRINLEKRARSFLNNEFTGN